MKSSGNIWKAILRNSLSKKLHIWKSTGRFQYLEKDKLVENNKKTLS